MTRLLFALLTLLFSLSGLAMGGYSDFRQSSNLVNAGISAGRGDFVGAGFNLASSLPGLGDAFAAGKIATAAVGVAVAKSASHAVSSTAATAAKVEAAAAKTTTTVLGSGADVAPYAGKPGFNVLSMDRSLPLETRKAINVQWLDDAIDRGDDILLKTDPIKWDRFMREIGKESFYNEVELPRLLQRGVIDRATLGY